MAFGLDDALIAGTIGIATGATTGAFNLFGGSQTNAATKELAKLQQYYAVQNAYLAHQFEQENLATQGCQAKSLQASAFQFDRELAKYNRRLSKLSADEDYARAVQYIADAQSAYKKALIQNGYNPLLALGSSIPSYIGHTNPATGSVGASSAGSASTSAAPHAGSGGQGANLNLGESVGSGVNAFNSALNFSRTASEIKANESQIELNKATAAKELENAIGLREKREPEIDKTKSSTIKDYTSAAHDVLAPVGSAYVGAQLAKNAPKLRNAIQSAVKSGNEQKVKDLLPKYQQPIMKEGNSAYLGSRALQAALPVLFGVGAGYGTGKVIENYNNKHRTLSEQFAKPNPFIATGFGL